MDERQQMTVCREALERRRTQQSNKPMTVCREAPERRRTQQSNNKNTGETEITDSPDCRFGGIPEGNTVQTLLLSKRQQLQ